MSESRLIRGNSMYQCPTKRVALRSSETGLVEEAAGVFYPVRNGVPNFLARQSITDDQAPDLEALNERAKVVGARAAYLEQRGNDPYVYNDSRHPYVNLLNLSKKDTVLEIGCSMGQCTMELARRSAQVWALDIVAQQAEFVLLRARDEGLDNIRASAGGEDGRLPFADASFDVVVLNLVLEWCGSRSNEPHEVVQERLLGEIQRVLVPGGRLWVSTKNRYSLRLVIGGEDEHMDGLRFGSALPRWLSRALLARRGIPRAQGKLYSHTALKRLIRSTGFSSVTAYWSMPDPRYPDQIVKADAQSIRSARRAHDGARASGRINNLLTSWVPPGLVPHIAAGNSFIAQK